MTMKSTFCLLAALVFLLFFSGCAVTNKFGPYLGKVVDAETKEPIEGAVVFMGCSTVTGNPGGATTHYADFAEVLTDENGEFYIELRATTFRPGHLWGSSYVSVFKPGYGVFPMHPNANVDILIRNTSHIFPENTYVTITLPKLRTLEERKDNLRHIWIPSESKVPFEKRKEIFRLRNIESVEVGLKPYSIPK